MRITNDELRAQVKVCQEIRNLKGFKFIEDMASDLIDARADMHEIMKILFRALKEEATPEVANRGA